MHPATEAVVYVWHAAARDVGAERHATRVSDPESSVSHRRQSAPCRKPSGSFTLLDIRAFLSSRENTGNPPKVQRRPVPARGTGTGAGRGRLAMGAGMAPGGRGPGPVGKPEPLWRSSWQDHRDRNAGPGTATRRAACHWLNTATGSGMGLPTRTGLLVASSTGPVRVRFPWSSHETPRWT